MSGASTEPRLARWWLVVAVVALCAGGVGVLAGLRPDGPARAAEAARQDAERDQRTNSSERAKVEDQLDSLADRLGAPLDSSGEPSELPPGYEANLLTPTVIPVAFGGSAVDDGLVYHVVKVEEVDQVELKPNDGIDGLVAKPPRKPRDGGRLVRVELVVVNRSGDVADPACGVIGFFDINMVDGDGKVGGGPVEAPFVQGTYPTACKHGLPDGAAGQMTLAFQLDPGEEMTGILFTQNTSGTERSGLSDAAMLVFDAPV